ncbi:MAG TPA: UDP-N-acetylmuramate dehydrogenase [Micromonospora sp.]
MSDVSVSATLTDVTAPQPLSTLTTLGLGGPPDRLVTARDADELVACVREADRLQQPTLILAGGSNVVIGDDGFPGTVVLVRSRGTRVLGRDGDTLTVRVEAGEPWDEFVAATVTAGWSGLECLSGIPGTAGATPIQNVGAYGQEVAETIVAVQVYDRLADEVRTMAAEECGFGYRTSVFKGNGRWVVLSVDFRLVRSSLSTPVRYAELARSLGVEVGDRVPLAEAREHVLALRARKGMVLDPNDPDTRSVGSFFTNPVLSAEEYARLRERAGELGDPPAWPAPDGTVKVSAAWLIDQAGFPKGFRRPGGVAISSKHTLALTHRGGGSTAALLALAAEIRDGVRERFGVTLQPEPVLVNCEL